MTYTQDDFERDYEEVMQAVEGDPLPNCGSVPSFDRIIAAYRDLVAEVKRSHDAILALTAENERLSELMEWREKEIADRHASLVYALKQENERLREQRIIVNRVKRVPDSGFDLLDELDEWKARAEAAEAENERLVATKRDLDEMLSNEMRRTEAAEAENERLRSAYQNCIDALEKRDAEIERLKAQSCVEFDDVLRTNEKLVAENERLRNHMTAEEQERLETEAAFANIDFSGVTIPPPPRAMPPYTAAIGEYERGDKPDVALAAWEATR